MSAAPPRFATAPTPGAAHELAQVVEVGRVLGTPLMPWQRQVARVATEKRPNGRWRYPTVVVTVPRQSGKTTLMRTILTQRAITRTRHLEFYSAQTGKDARARWRDLVEAVENGPLAEWVEVRKGAGDSSLTFTRTGSSIAPFAPGPKSLHGYTPPLVMLDECFAFTEAQGSALLGAISPAQITLPDRQLWLVSTMGNAESAWFHEWVDRGRESSGDPESGLAYFEWAAPEGADAYDPEVWAGFHPALGHTITVEALAGDAETLPPGEWERAYCNRRTLTSESIIDADEFRALASPATPPAEGVTVGIGFDVARDLSRAAVRAVWEHEGTTYSRVIASAAGIDWLADTLTETLATIPGAVLVTTENGPVRQITDQLTAAGVEWQGIAERDFATAGAAWLWRSHGGRHRHDGDPWLAESVRAAGTRPTTTGGWVLSRNLSSGCIADLVAEVVALRAATLEPVEEAPAVVFA